jgi:hypothetical protein
MEIRTERASCVSLDGAPWRPGKKGIECDRLAVSLDLSPLQWTAVFPEWYSRAGGAPASLLRESEQLRIQGLAAWVFRGVKADGSGRSRCWRVYLLPRGRHAIVVRSIGWQSADAGVFASQLDEAASEADAS